ncbi:MAG: recombinase family protein [Chloroflexi bacterium]|nr:recombinase family protein [Chloroflexota bacterium]
MADYFPPPRDLRPGSTVWAYLRDSGGPTQENSVTQQETEIHAYCDRHNLALVETFRDVAKSGGSTISRDGFERMIDMSEIKPPHGLLIWNFARFSRDENDSKFYRALLRKRGIIIHSLTDPIPTDEFAPVIESLVDFANAEKRRQNSRDVKRGLASLVSQGFAPGTPPKGYIRVPVEIGFKRDGTPRIVSKWERDPALWDSVVLAWQMRAEGKSYKEIQEATEGRIYKSLPCWCSFFKNKNYLGSFTFGGKEYPDHHEPAITEDVWEAVKKIRDDNPLHKNHLRHPRRVGNPSLLTGFTYCLECGAMMTHSPGHKDRSWRFYICGKKDKQGVQSCTSRRVGEKPAEDAILETIRDKILSPAYLEQVIESARLQFGDTSDLERRIALARRNVEDLEIAIHRTLRAIEKTDSDLAYQRHAQLEQERAQGKAEIDHMESQLAAAKIEITPEAMTLVLDAWRDQFNQARESNNIRFIRTWLYRFVSKVELGYNRARIYFTYPLIDFSLPGNSSRHAYPLRGGTDKENAP